MGAWIEILKPRKILRIRAVAPPVGAWIEMCKILMTERYPESLPPWERGLKSHVITSHIHTG